MTPDDVEQSMTPPTDGHRAPQRGRQATKSAPEGEDTREQVSEPQIASPKGPWQTPSLTLTECTRHKGLCAYRQGDHERCDACHANWSTITVAWGEGRAEHIAQHARDDEIATGKAARLAAVRAARKTTTVTER